MIPSDINETVREVLNLLGSEMRESRITVDENLATGLPTVLADRI